MKKILMIMGVACLAVSGRADTLLLSDNFNSPSTDASIFNSTLAADQGGTLAPLNYTVAAGAGYQAQHGNGGTMLLTGGAASPNHDFAGDANTANAPLVIQFDMNNNGGATDWGAFSIDSNTTRDWQNATKISILKRNNGGIDVTTNGVAAASMTGSTTRIMVVVSDTAGTGSAFNGNGTVVKFYDASTNLLGTYALDQLYPYDCYLSFSGSWWAGWSVMVDNLAISLAATRTVTYDGNLNTGGTVPTDSNLYVSGETATALGNTGGLVKTGLSFIGWNTAADGSGTSYLPGAAVTVTASTILYAQWGTGVSVFYDGNGNTAGSVPIDSNNPYPPSSVVSVLGNTGNLTKTGQSFARWNTAANGSGTSYNPASTFTLASNTTLFAQWTNNYYTITYTAGANGTISGTAIQTVVFGNSGSPVTAVPNAGYRFVAWSDGVVTANRTDSNFSSNLTVTATFDNNLVWNNGAATGNWNTADTNWTGVIWVNGIPDNAVFSHTASPATVTLAQALTAGSVMIGNGGNNANYTFISGPGGSLQAGSLILQAASANDPNSVGYPTTTLSNANISISGNIGIGRGRLTIGGNSIVTADQIGGNIAGVSSPDWGILTIQDSAVVTATNGVNGDTAAWGLNLNGGTLITSGIRVAPLYGNTRLTFNGGHLKASTNNAAFITIQTPGWSGWNEDPNIGSAGLRFDTDGHAVGISQNLVGAGSLTKAGLGTLTFSGTNTYAGGTYIQGGVISFASTAALPGNTLDITNGGIADLNYAGTVNLGSLVLNGTNQLNGTYGATGSGATYINDTYFTGSGVLNVYAPPANQVLIWTAAVNNNWDEATGNWTNNVPWTQWFNNTSSPNSATFDATGLGQPNVNVAFSSTFYASNLTVNAAGYSISGNALTLGNTPTLTVNANFTMGNVLTGAGGLTKTGNATLTLTGANNTYTGNTTVGAGTLEIGGSGGFDQTKTGGAVTVSNGATILISSTANNALPFQNATPAWTVAGTLNVTGGGANTLPAAGVVLNNGTLTGTPANLTYGTYLAVQAANNIITANGSANAISSDNFAVSQTLTLNTPLAGDTLVASSGFFDGFAGAGSLAKSGLGTVTLSGASTYTGNTAINAGALLVNGSITAGATVNGGALAGAGTIGGPVTVNGGGTIAAGAALNGIGILSISSNLTMNGNVLVNLKKGQAQSNTVFAVSGVLTNANGAATTLTVSNLGPALAVGDKFTLFSKAVGSGATVTIVPPAGYTFNNNLASDGSISVATTPPPPVLGYSKSGNSLTFNWTGSGTLQVQTNTVSKGLSTNWVDYPNGTNGVGVPINSANGSVFFRVKQ